MKKRIKNLIFYLSRQETSADYFSTNKGFDRISVFVGLHWPNLLNIYHRFLIDQLYYSAQTAPFVPAMLGNCSLSLFKRFIENYRYCRAERVSRLIFLVMFCTTLIERKQNRERSQYNYFNKYFDDTIIL